jgi:hypothetical protein
VLAVERKRKKGDIMAQKMGEKKKNRPKMIRIPYLSTEK